jgi:hypothetical protein
VAEEDRRVNEVDVFREDAVEAELLSGPGLPIEDARRQVVFLDRRLPFRGILERMARDLIRIMKEGQRG